MSKDTDDQSTGQDAPAEQQFVFSVVDSEDDSGSDADGAAPAGDEDSDPDVIEEDAEQVLERYFAGCNNDIERLAVIDTVRKSIKSFTQNDDDSLESSELFKRLASDVLTLRSSLAMEMDDDFANDHFTYGVALFEGAVRSVDPFQASSSGATASTAAAKPAAKPAAAATGNSDEAADEADPETLDDFDEAWEMFEIARLHFESTSNRLGLARVHNYLGQIYIDDSANAELALAEFDKSASFLDRDNPEHARRFAELDFNRLRAHLLTNDFRGARRCLDEAIATLRTSANTATTASSDLADLITLMQAKRREVDALEAEYGNMKRVASEAFSDVAAGFGLGSSRAAGASAPGQPASGAGAKRNPFPGVSPDAPISDIQSVVRKKRKTDE
ncbi:hypothetical protein H696_01431 [Fonticula alba]|uniref:Tetratricopeptide SHNi-TPR domain-containing protein n=1 Tax=Fonticula alba TaxID=691883 RepID=A0A058ZCB7_FONAL|nr:hypothetical protein H696_01431 [Fonticula alba]KCV72024.1 hypothetical protein H696_01431 [Fonticula alba]|eukprot:XP_009493602.1 hypothetical protein H696_01431 [Fonticula alba]